MLTYFTENSQYDMDRENNVYRRTPLPDTHPQIVHSPRLKYGEWLPLKDFHVESSINGDILRIFAPDSTYGIQTTPLVRTEPD